MELIQLEYRLILWSIFSLFILIVWITTIVSIANSNFIDHRTKLGWGLIVFFLPLIGTILYHSIGRNQKINNQ